MSTVVSTVTNKRFDDTQYIVQQRSALTSKSGYIQIVFNSLLQDVQDIPSTDFPLNYAPAVIAPEGDLVPLYGVQNVPAPNGNNIAIIAHPCSKLSGLRAYTRKTFIFAVNNGKLDANAKMCSTAEAELIAVTLAKIPELPCNDTVIATLDYTITVSVA